MTLQPNSDNRVIPPSIHNDSSNRNINSNNNNQNNNPFSSISQTSHLTNRFSSFKSSPPLSSIDNTMSIATLNANGLHNSLSKFEYIIEELLLEQHRSCWALQPTDSLDSAILPRFRNIMATHGLNSTT